MQASGWYYDGRVSVRRPVVVSLNADLLEFRGEGIELALPLSSVEVTSGVGDIRRFLKFPGGGMCDVDDKGFLDRVLAGQGKRSGHSRVHRWEKSLACVGLALMAIVAIVGGAVRYGVPVLAEKAARAIPKDVEARMGTESLALLDRIAFAPTGLPGKRQDEIREIFRDVTRWAALEGKARLEFRKGGPLGANALALPAGIVVMTDELAAMAGNDHELAAVLAHEAEHVRRGHSLRHVLQSSATALVVAAVTGDIGSISSLAAGAPTLLINAKYSRDFEREADEAVAVYLKSRNIPLRRYADMLGRLQAELERAHSGNVSSFTNYLSSHPPVPDRMKRFSIGDHSDK